MDSQFLCDCLSNGYNPPWKCIYLIQSILAMQRECQFTFQHYFREANSMADRLANLACDSLSDFDFEDLSAFPHTIRGHILLDAQGTPHMRTS